MARYRRINLSMWGDEKFRGLKLPPPEPAFVWMCLLAGPATTNLPGVVIGHPTEIAMQIGFFEPRFIRKFTSSVRKLEQTGMLMADFGSRLIFLSSSIRHNKPENPNVVRSWTNVWELVTECPLKAQIPKIIGAEVSSYSEPFRKAFAEVFGEAPAKGLPQGSAIQIQEQIQSQDLCGPLFEKESPSGKPEKPKPKTRTKVAAKKMSDHSLAIAHFEELYLSAYAAKPTWNGKSGALVKRLLEAHRPNGLAVFKDRSTRMFKQTPEWLLRDGTALDLGTLSANYDKFAGSQQPKSRPTGYTGPNNEYDDLDAQVKGKSRDR